MENSLKTLSMNVNLNYVVCKKRNNYLVKQKNRSRVH